MSTVGGTMPMVGYDKSVRTYVARMPRGNQPNGEPFEALRAVIKEQIQSGQLTPGEYEVGVLNGLGFRLGRLGTHRDLRGILDPNDKCGPLEDWLQPLIAAKLQAGR